MITQIFRASIVAGLACSIHFWPALGQADVLNIANSSFEALTLSDGSTSTAAINNWGKLGPVSLLNPASAQFPSGSAADGNNVAVLGASGSILHQDLVGETLQSGLYSISFAVGNRLDQAQPDLSFHLLINATTIIPLTSSFTPAVADGEYQTWTFNYDTTNANVFGNFYGDPLRIRFLVNDGATGGSMVVDRVQGTFTSIPEPSYALPLLAIAGYLFTRRPLRQ